MKLLDAINKRRSIRKFKDKNVKWADVLEAIDAALKTPLAGNISTLRFIIITEQETKNKLAQYSDQLWISEADTIVAVCSDTTNLQQMYDDRADKYAKLQVGAAIQNFMLRLTELGLSSCWVGAYLDSEIKRHLKVPDHINVEALLPIGYADETPKKIKKASIQQSIFWEQWNIKKKPVQARDPTTW